MRPFPAVATGFVLLLLSVTVGGFDLLADPLAWLLVLYGTAHLEAGFPLRTLLQYAAGVALVVSVPLWIPPVLDALSDADPVVGWVANLPTFAFWVLLSHAAARAAAPYGARVAVAAYRTAEVGAVAVAVLPLLVFGAGLDGLAAPAGILVQLVPLSLVVLLLTHGSLPWAGAGPGETSNPPSPRTT